MNYKSYLLLLALSTTAHAATLSWRGHLPGYGKTIPEFTGVQCFSTIGR